VAGVDVVADPHEARRRLGLVGQDTAVDEVLGAHENLVLFGRLLGHDRQWATRRAEELLERFGLAAAGHRAVGTFSGGMRRRLDLAASLVVDPALLLLDEPTTGLDPQGRRDVWDTVAALARDGAAVLLTTQHLEEADRLADTVAVLRDGRIAACGAPDELKSAVGGDRIDVVLRERETTGTEGRAGGIAAAATGGTAVTDGATITVTAPRSRGAVGAVVAALSAAGVDVADIAVRRPTLDEVYLRLVGPQTADGRQQVTA
jgi:ABC-2 type transport system ATP-binding protein